MEEIKGMVECGKMEENLQSRCCNIPRNTFFVQRMNKFWCLFSVTEEL